MKNQNVQETLQTTKTNESEMKATTNNFLKDVNLNGKFNVNSALYCNNVSIEGSGEIGGSIFSKGTIRIILNEENTHNSIIINGSMSTLKHVLVNGTKYQGNESVPQNLKKSPLIIKGSIIGDSVSLDNAIVFGNVFAKNAQISRSIILGIVYTEKQLNIEDAMLISFDSDSIVIKGACTMLSPYGRSKSVIHFERESLQENGKKDAFTAKLRYLPLCRSSVTGCGLKEGDYSCPLFLARNAKKTCPYSNILFHPDDVVIVNDTYSNASQNWNVLTLSPRILDYAVLESEIQKTEQFLDVIINYDQFDQFKKEHLKELRNLFSEDEKILFDFFIKGKK